MKIGRRAGPKPRRGNGRPLLAAHSRMVLEWREKWRLIRPDEPAEREAGKSKRSTPGAFVAATVCWFCGREFGGDDALQKTREHLTARSRGGGNDSKNVVAAHKICNELAGSIRREEKEILRQILTAAGTPETWNSQREALGALLEAINPELAAGEKPRRLGELRDRCVLP